MKMKILYYDCFSGISGDMNLAALIDIGVPANFVILELKKLNLDGYEIKVTRDIKMGISGTRVDVTLTETHEDNEHHDHLEQHHHEHQHRGLKDIEHIIMGSQLSENVKKLSLYIFSQVAKAEAKVHDKPIYEVHFHEVGAVDSIVDTVAAAIALDYLKVEKVICSTIELGGGFVKCAHGIMPVPAPAVVEILTGVPVKSGRVQFETTTPTGAAILKATVNEYNDNKNFKIKKVGYGIGHRDTEIPNVLRVFLGDIEEKTLNIEKNYVLECNIDDMNPEIYDYIMEGLFERGAADVFLTPIIMKKGRPGVKLTVILSTKNYEAIKEFILCETSTLGFRKYQVEKTMLKREFVKVNTKFGTVTVKNAYYKGKKIKSKPEYSECRKLAEENRVSLREIYDEFMIK